jgi:hypothetical protein
VKLGLGISENKIIPRKKIRQNKWFVPTKFRLFSAEQRTLGITFQTIPRNKIEANFWNLVPKHFSSQFCVSYFGWFVKAIFSVIPFRYEFRNRLFRWTRMPGNGHFLPRNNGNRSESIPWHFFFKRNAILNPRCNDPPPLPPPLTQII